MANAAKRMKEKKARQLAARKPVMVVPVVDEVVEIKVKKAKKIKPVVEPVVEPTVVESGTVTDVELVDEVDEETEDNE